MTAKSEAYSQAAHIRHVQAAAREAGIKGAAYSVLSYLCSVSDFKKPITRASKEKIEARTGYCEKTIKGALAALRQAGFIEPVAFATGGRGLCPVYVLRSKKGVENLPPLEPSDLVKGGKKFPEKGGKNFQKRGEKTSPPTDNLTPFFPERSEGAASSGGRATRALDAGASPGPRPGSPEAAELARLGRETAAFGYTEAKRRADERKAKLERGELP